MSGEPQEQDLFLKCLLEANVDGIIAFDREYRYTTWNRAMERISGVKREEVLGKCALEIFPCLIETGEDKFYREALAGRSVVAENRRFTIAHEIGHFVLRHHSQRNELVHADDEHQVIYRSPRASTGQDPLEVQANQFAASLLMPTRLIQERAGRLRKPLSEDAVAALAREFKVSEQAMTIRLSTLGLI